MTAVVGALAPYGVAHPDAQIDVYRHNSVSIRIRVIDAAFAGVSRADRHDIVWNLLDPLPEDVLSQVSLVIPLTPHEAQKSLANLEFEEPIPSAL